jgi:acyl carrier protein
VNGIDEFLTLIRDELGLPVTAADTGQKLSDLPGWDSMHLLWLVSVLEQRYGRTLGIVDVLEATTLAEVYGVAEAR